MTVIYNGQVTQKIFGLHYWLLENKYILINKEVIKFGFHNLSASGKNIGTKWSLECNPQEDRWRVKFKSASHAFVFQFPPISARLVKPFKPFNAFVLRWVKHLHFTLKQKKYFKVFIDYTFNWSALFHPMVFHRISISKTTKVRMVKFQLVNVWWATTSRVLYISIGGIFVTRFLFLFLFESACSGTAFCTYSYFMSNLQTINYFKY